MTNHYAIRFVLHDDWRILSVQQQSNVEGNHDWMRVRDYLTSALQAFDNQSTTTTITSSQYGLYLPSRGYWLDNDRNMRDFQLTTCHCQSISAVNGHSCDVIELQDRQRFVHDASQWLHYAEGWASKKGDRSILWRERYMVLRNRQLSYYKSDRDSSVPLGTIDLQPGRFSVTAMRQADGDQQCYFELVQGKSYRLRFNSPSDASMWWRILCSLRLPDLSSSSANTIRQTAPSFSTALESSAYSSTADSDQSNEPDNGNQNQNPNKHSSSISSSDSDTDDNSANVSSPLTRAVSNRRPLFETFCHMRLVDAVKKSKSPNYREPSPLLIDGPATHIDVQGDKLGFLYKKGDYNRSLKYRLFVLRNKILYYYKLSSARGRRSGAASSSKSAAAVGTGGSIPGSNGAAINQSLQHSNYVFAGLINLEGCRMYTDRKRGKKSFIIRIVAPAKSYLICTDDREEYQDWLDAFEFICGIHLEDMSTAMAQLAASLSSKRQSLQLAHEEKRVPDDNRENANDGGLSDRANSIISADSGSDQESSMYNHRQNSCAAAAARKPHKAKLILDMERLGNPDMEGLLWKQGNDRLGKWRERYFMLLGRSLFYGPPSRRTQPFGSIPLSICRLRRKPAAEQHQTTDEASSSSSSSASSALMFEIVMTNEDLCDPVLRVYRLRAPNQESYDAWLQILQIHVNAIEE